MWLIGITFAACIIASVILSSLGFIPDKYMQPVSAIYIVPFLLMLGVLKQSIIGGPILLIWPGLYTLHAMLILAGVPIVFSGPWACLNILIPVVGYGLLTAIIAHLYSRFALWKLRRMVRDDLQDEPAEDRRQ
jgi:hypothetical protein